MQPTFRLAILATTLCITGLNAQSARLLGKVVARDGSPVEGAEVVLRAHGWPLHPELGEVHEQRCTSARNGRFRAKVHADLEYSAWAVLPGETPRFTEVAERVLAGRPVTLREESFERGAVTVRVAGLEAWKRFGPFRFRVLSQAHNYDERIAPLGDDAVAEIPPMPGKNFYFELVDHAGQILTQTRVRNAPTKSKERGPYERRLTVPEPIAVRLTTVRFEDPDKPIAGVVVKLPFTDSHGQRFDLERTRRRMVTRVFGETDERGALTLELPLPENRLYNSLVLRAPGRVLTSAQLASFGNAQKSFSEIKKNEDGSIDVRVKLKRGAASKGRVLDRDGKPIAGLVLAAARPAALWFDDNGASWRNYPPRLLETDAEGRFRLQAVLRNYSGVLVALPNAEQRARLLPADASARRPLRSVPLAFLRSKKADGAPELGDLEPELRCLAIELVHRDRPLAYARLVLLDKAQGHDDFPLDRTWSDRRGRAQLFASGRACRVLAWDETTGYAIEEIEPSKPEAAPHKLEARDFRWISGVVLDAEDKPVVGAEISTNGATWRGGTRAYVVKINERLRDSVRTDEAGKFRIPFIPEPNWGTELQAMLRVGTKVLRSSSAHVDTADQDVTELELRFGQAIAELEKKDG